MRGVTKIDEETILLEWRTPKGSTSYENLFPRIKDSQGVHHIFMMLSPR